LRMVLHHLHSQEWEARDAEPHPRQPVDLQVKNILLESSEKQWHFSLFSLEDAFFMAVKADVIVIC
ncbi:hypothetical protein T05_15639, partial [Trichinella murrelli]